MITMETQATQMTRIFADKNRFLVRMSDSALGKIRLNPRGLRRPRSNRRYIWSLYYADIICTLILTSFPTFGK